MGHPQKILIAIGSSEIGGAQKVVGTIVRQLIYEGNKLIVVLPKGPFFDSLVKDRIETIPINFKSIFGILKIFKLLKSNEIAVVNTHLTNCSLVFAIINIFFSKILCCSLHNSIVHEKLNRIQKFIYPYFYFLIYKLSNGIIVNSEKNKHHLFETANIPKDHIKVIYNGIDIRDYTFDNHFIKRNSKKFQIAFIGRLSVEKGVIYLIEALSRLEELDFECKIIGDGPLRSVLETEVQVRGLANKVKFLGFQENVTPFFHHMDLFILPSLNEVLPITIIEAFAHKVITISADVGGVAELITHLETGLLFPARDVDKLCEQINFVFKNRKSIQYITKNAYYKYYNEYTSEIMVTKTKEYYKQLIFNN